MTTCSDLPLEGLNKPSSQRGAVQPPRGWSGRGPVTFDVKKTLDLFRTFLRSARSCRRWRDHSRPLYAHAQNLPLSGVSPVHTGRMPYRTAFLVKTSWERVMKKTVWIVVANRAVARLFRASQPTGPLEELDSFIHPEGRLQEHDLVSDRPGRAFDSFGSGRHAEDPDTLATTQEATNFAIEL